jgi:uracil-DNA glycosylase
MDVAAEARACTVCAAHLPLGPRPTFIVSPTARLLIVGQAPGTRVHETGIPWNDRSGDRLREWLGMDRAAFYDASRIAVLPVGLCYPGVLPRGGDAPPRPECAPRWHRALRATMPALRLTLLVGHHAQRLYLGPAPMTARVAQQPDDPSLFCLPHPSWRTTFWLARNPWFAEVTVPALRAAVARALGPCEAAA